MKINPQIKEAIIFSGGGGLAIREQKVKILPGKNTLEILEVPSSFDAETITVEIETEHKDGIKLVQVSVSLPDKTISDMVISREKSAANQIISQATDLRTGRNEILRICESAYYRQYEDMKGELTVIIQSDLEAEIQLTIKYFFTDMRIRWKPGIQVDLNENTARMVGYINVNNNSDFIFENVELKFAEFELAPEYADEDQYDFNEEEEIELDNPMKQYGRLKTMLA